MTLKSKQLDLRNRAGPCRLRSEITQQCTDILLGDAGTGAPGGDVVATVTRKGGTPVRDLTGQVFGELTVLERAENSKAGKARWLCRCSCSGTKTVLGAQLVNGGTKTCGDRKKHLPDLAGRKFGELTVLEELESHVTRDGKSRRVVKCFCSRCERETECRLEYLTRKKDPMTCCTECNRKAGVKKVKARAERARKEKPDLSGQEFGRWKVIARAPDYVSPSGVRAERWYCVCSCEKSEPRAVRRAVRRAYLEDGRSRSCGCLKNEHASASCFKDLTGKMFGQLFVLGRVDDYVQPNGNKQVQYDCVCCGCGETTVVRGEELRNGQKACRACGYEAASRATTVDLTGQRFGRLVAKVLTGWRDESHQAIWYCECDCGEPCFVHSGDLVSGNVGSCGCLKRGLSKLETYVKQYFDSEAVESFDRYDTEVKFEDLRGVSDGKLSYDFGLYDGNGNLECLIECQGWQHYEPVDRFGGENQLEVQQFHDELKREYASNHGVRLIEVPYTLRTYDKVAAYLRDAGIS